MGVLEDIALVAQLSGLHAIMLVTLALRLLRIPQCEAECAKLEECARKLRTLLQWPAPTGRDGDVAAQAQLAAWALVEADGLMVAYLRSSLWCKLRTGRSMEARLRGMQDRVNFLCVLLLCVHAYPLTDHPASDTDATTVISDPLHARGASDSASYSTCTCQGGADDQTEPGGFESAV